MPVSSATTTVMGANTLPSTTAAAAPHQLTITNKRDFTSSSTSKAVQTKSAAKPSFGYFARNYFAVVLLLLLLSMAIVKSTNAATSSSSSFLSSLARSSSTVLSARDDDVFDTSRNTLGMYDTATLTYRRKRRSNTGGNRRKRSRGSYSSLISSYFANEEEDDDEFESAFNDEVRESFGAHVLDDEDDEAAVDSYDMDASEALQRYYLLNSKRARKIESKKAISVKLTREPAETLYTPEVQSGANNSDNLLFPRVGKETTTASAVLVAKQQEQQQDHSASVPSAAPSNVAQETNVASAAKAEPNNQQQSVPQPQSDAKVLSDTSSSTPTTQTTVTIPVTELEKDRAFYAGWFQALLSTSILELAFSVAFMIPIAVAAVAALIYCVLQRKKAVVINPVKPDDYIRFTST